MPNKRKLIFEDAKLIDVGAINDSPSAEFGFRLCLTDDRIITVTGLTVDECRKAARLLDDVVVLELRDR